MNSISAEIHRLSIPLDKYKERLREIELYIEITDNQKKFISDSREIIGNVSNENTEFCEDYIEKISDITNSAVLYNAAIISIYGSYEFFLDEILKCYIDFVSRYYSNYRDIPLKIQSRHKEKAVEFLDKSRKFSRYGITDEKVIESLHSSINGNSVDFLISDLLISHSGNMNGKQLRELFNELDINQIDQFLYHNKNSLVGSNHTELDYQSGEKLEISHQNHVFRTLDQIVEKRNEVAHGWVVENRVVFANMLDTYIPYLLFLCESIEALLISQVISIYVNEKKLTEFDKILHLWKDGQVVAINNKNAKLSIGKIVFYKDTNGFYYTTKISELRNNDKYRTKIIKDNIDITMEIDKKIKETYILYYD